MIGAMVDKLFDTVEATNADVESGLDLRPLPWGPGPAPR